MILSQAIIADIVPASERGKYLGPLGGIFGLAAVGGPLLGGFFVDHLSWQWAFYINIPVGVAALRLPNKKPVHPIDWLGVLFLSAATTCLIFLADFGGSADHGWTAWSTWGWPAGLVVSVGLFSVTEARVAGPIMPLSMFRNPIFVNATAIVLVVQNAVSPNDIGTATATNNYFREAGGAVGIAVFGTIFTSRLTENLTTVFTDAGADAEQAAQATATIDPAVLQSLPAGVRDGIVAAYADALAPVFWYLIPFMVIALVLALRLKEIPLSDVAGMVARGEAIGGAEAERLERL
ncbi:hypothetical protein ACTI_50180 [Actinoplanes sp. OR16]|uniref:MFS transporter n=1 Tax=Actinoplanes sp. OR16 TaxID=946334 RepID=UPI000F70EAE0|nr:MFS transporter [Actinoplanes sp. OR16]BBH68333.1 hypothetical protein ACTI_50180 [Actinoplanes sp. OR16]